ncbi:alpha/beta hydrolase [Lentzea tibetensis]|uniref:Alpha/beta hydrolase n=1 Tax=Lentzea tibetensis TaxID=2591470 RepID=A0A563EST4_9PSEU|nr:alpha/beta hydrolase [Lentzea tibetensis]TWP50795.1 alpha/beta hydrolase [Lentzea tibetensis]
MIETDLALADGRTVHVYDTGPAGELVVFWHHGTPNIGTPPEPLFAVSDQLGIRWVSFDRPGYGGSSPQPGRTVGSVAADVAEVADALGIERFAVMGHSGGGSFALGCGALLPDRVVAVVSAAGIAPFDAAGLDWFAGMSESSAGSLRSAAAGRVAKEAYEARPDNPEMEFAPADLAAFDGPWGWFGSVVGPALAGGPAPLIEDDLAYVTPWGCDPTTITAPVLLLHGGQDRVIPSSHGEWLARHCPTAELRLFPEHGHISVLNDAPAALEWLRTAGDRSIGLP